MNVSAHVFLVKSDLGWQLRNIIETQIDKNPLLFFAFIYLFFGGQDQGVLEGHKHFK